MERPTGWDRQAPESKGTLQAQKTRTAERYGAPWSTSRRESQASALSLRMLSYQEFSPLLPMATLGIGAAMGLRRNMDQIPLFRSGLWSLLQ